MRQYNVLESMYLLRLYNYIVMYTYLHKENHAFYITRTFNESTS